MSLLEAAIGIERETASPRPRLASDPEDDLTIVLLTNSDSVEAWKVDDDIARAVLGMAPRRQ